MESNKKLLFKKEAQQKILEGVQILTNAVKSTLGPKGRNVVIERPGQAPHVTKDGVTVARSINLKNQFHNLGVQMIKEVAGQTVDVAGDGTTTATVLACHIYQEGLSRVHEHGSSIEIKKGIDFAVEHVCQELDKIANPVNTRDEIVHIGTVSSNGDERVGEMLASAMEKVGKDGVITVEEAKGYDTKLEVVEGMRINRGYVSPYFITNSEKMECVLENPYILISDNKYDQMKEIVPLLEQIRNSSRPILIIADDFGGEALHGLTVNHQKGTIKACAIRAPEFGSSRHGALEDITVLTGGKIVSMASGISIPDINLSDPKQCILGTCKKVIISKNFCTIVGNNDRQEQLTTRIDELKGQLEDPTVTANEEGVLHRRLARLSGGIAIIRVGGATEVEMRELKDRIDDALCATQAAVESGLVPGGGVALVRAGSTLEPIPSKGPAFCSGISIVQDACFSPLSQIITNAGSDPDVIIPQIIKSKDVDYGWNASTEKFCRMIDEGIIDPLKVAKTALRNAASVAGLMLTIDCAIVEEDVGLFGQPIPPQE